MTPIEYYLAKKSGVLNPKMKGLLQYFPDLDHAAQEMGVYNERTPATLDQLKYGLLGAYRGLND